MDTGKQVELPITTPLGPSEKRTPGIPSFLSSPAGIGSALYLFCIFGPPSAKVQSPDI